VVPVVLDRKWRALCRTRTEGGRPRELWPDPFKWDGFLRVPPRVSYCLGKGERIRGSP